MKTPTSVLVMLLLAAAAPASGGQYAPNKANPYRNLFVPPKTLNAVAPAVPKDASKPTVVWGLKVIPGDPSIDPTMLRSPKSDGVNYTIRAIDPPICNPAPGR